MDDDAGMSTQPPTKRVGSGTRRVERGTVQMWKTRSPNWKRRRMHG